MTRVDFYFNAPDKLATAARLVRKACRAKKKVLVFTRDAAMLDAFDRLLWTAPAIGFVPHCRAHDALAGDTPVLLTADAAVAPHHEILLNLDHERPDNFSRFDRLLEIVSRDDADDRSHARARFKFYRDRGYEIVQNDLNQAVNQGTE